MSRIGFATDACNNPLVHVAAEMQHQVTDGVFVFSAPGPHLLLAQLGKASIEAR
jgi:hypothetical protein